MRQYPATLRTHDPRMSDAEFAIWEASCVAYRKKRTSAYRWRLFCKSPKCHWCGIATRLVGPDESGALPDDAATIDHLYSRRVRREGIGNRAVVLACSGCNQHRNDEENRLLAEGYAIKDAASLGLSYRPVHAGST